MDKPQSNAIQRNPTQSNAEINALKAEINALKTELDDERHRHDRYVDFELAQSKELAAAKADLKAMSIADDSVVCTLCKHQNKACNEKPCVNCSGFNSNGFEWRGVQEAGQ